MTLFCNIAGDYIAWIGPNGETIVNTTFPPAILDINPTDSSHGDLYTCQGILAATGVIQSVGVNFFAVSKYFYCIIFYVSIS